MKIVRSIRAALRLAVGNSFSLTIDAISRRNKNKQLKMFRAVINKVLGVDNPEDVDMHDISLTANAYWQEGKRIKENIHDISLTANAFRQERKRIKENMIKFVREEFGEKLTEKLSKVVARIFVKTDMATLDGKYSLDEIRRLIADKDFLESTIAELTSKVIGVNRKYYLGQVKATAYRMITGRNKHRHVMENADNIVHLAGTSKTLHESYTLEEVCGMVEIIDELTTLYAIKYTALNDRTQAAELMDRESAREGKRNGVNFVIKVAKVLKEDSKSILFSGSEVLMTKGYIKEKTNSYISVEMASQKDAEHYRLAGYTLVNRLNPLEQDPLFPDEEMDMWEIRDRGLQPFVSGAIQNMGKYSKGTLKNNVNRLVNPVSYLGETASDQERQKLQKTLDADIEKLFDTPESWEPDKEASKTYLLPLMNLNREVAGYRYTMNEATKDDVFEREMRIEHVLGVTAASIYDKENAFDISKKVLDFLLLDYNTNEPFDIDGYIEVGPKSTDPKIRERWRLIPNETKTYILDTWGREKFYVNQKYFTRMLGYRKFSVADSISKPEKKRNIIEKAIVPLLRQLLGKASFKQILNPNAPVSDKKLATKIVRIETRWHEMVKIIKDNFFIKILSTETMQYQKDARKAKKLELMIKGGYLIEESLNEANQKLLMLKEDMQRNPMNPILKGYKKNKESVLKTV